MVSASRTWIILGGLLGASSCSAVSAGSAPTSEPISDWNELSRWLPEPSWGQWAEISASLKKWRPEQLVELEPILERWDAQRRDPWLRVLDPETTERWLERASPRCTAARARSQPAQALTGLCRDPLTPQERWLARWSDRLHLTEDQLARFSRQLASPRWWASSPIVVGPSARPTGWGLMLPDGDFEMQLTILRAIDESGRRLVQLGFINHYRVRFEALAGSPHIRHLEHLSLPCVPETHEGSDGLGSPTVDTSDGHCMTDRDLRALAASRTLGALHTLDLSRSRIGVVGLEALADSKTLGQVSHLNLQRSQALFQPIIEVLARLRQLREVDLSGIIGLDLSAEAGVTLPALERLRIRDSSLRDEAFARFLRNTRTPRLTHLEIPQNRKLGPLTAAALATDPDLSGLQVLDLHGAQLGDEAASRLAASEILSGLRELRLGQTGAGEKTARAVVANRALKLRALSLSAQAQPEAATLTASTAQVLAASPHLSDLRFLDLSFQPIGEAAIVALANSPYLRSLEHLALNWTGATDSSAVALAESPHLAGLRYLALGGQGLGSAARFAFARARHMTRLYNLTLYGGEVSREAARALREAPHLKGVRR